MGNKNKSRKQKRRQNRKQNRSQNRKQNRRQNKTKKGGKMWKARAGKFKDLKLTSAEMQTIIDSVATEPLKGKFEKIKKYNNHYLVGITDGKD